MAQNDGASAEDTPSTAYHYDLMEKNRATVREQGKKINRSLKRIRKISSEPKLELVSISRDDEPTDEFVTLPPEGVINGHVLKTAYEDVERKCKTPEASAEERPHKKKKRWFGWND